METVILVYVHFSGEEEEWLASSTTLAIEKAFFLVVSVYFDSNVCLLITKACGKTADRVDFSLP